MPGAGCGGERGLGLAAASALQRVARFGQHGVGNQQQAGSVPRQVRAPGVVAVVPVGRRKTSGAVSQTVIWRRGPAPRAGSRLI
jgi:hypothetical protein